MKFQLLEGQFEAKDALKILSQMVDVKIKYHESKIHSTSQEEDIKMRENRIRKLQNDLDLIRKEIAGSNGSFTLSSHIEIHPAG